ncbi:hypothetical protein HK105_205397 [Polyrhizophydium stewartii]|uniref:Uncharacterized protein n=3 Tax=Polyrhizophydium stewartii TaxID=2732419 RepID=A0ABR4N6H3_9FUNG
MSASGPTLPTLLGSSNWTQFSTAVELAAEILEVPNLHTTGTVPQGKAVAAARLRLAITNSIGEELLKQVPIETCKTAKDLFDALQTLCKTSEQQQRDVAMRTFTTPYADLAEPVEVYVARLVAVAGKFLVADEYVRAAFVLEMLSKGVLAAALQPLKLEANSKLTLESVCERARMAYDQAVMPWVGHLTIY